MPIYPNIYQTLLPGPIVELRGYLAACGLRGRLYAYLNYNGPTGTARDAIKHGETALKELEEKVGFAARYRRVQQTLEELEQLVIDARFECTGPNARLTTTEYAATLNKMLGLIRSIDEVNES